MSAGWALGWERGGLSASFFFFRHKWQKFRSIIKAYMRMNDGQRETYVWAHRDTIYESGTDVQKTEVCVRSCTKARKVVTKETRWKLKGS